MTSQKECSAISRVLILHVKKEFFDMIKSGEKTEEYRRLTPYWGKRLQGALSGRYSGIRIACGYPSWSDKARWLSFPWTGAEIKTITLPFFGSDPVEVIAIKLEQRRDTPAISQ